MKETDVHVIFFFIINLYCEDDIYNIMLYSINYVKIGIKNIVIITFICKLCIKFIVNVSASSKLMRNVEFFFEKEN